MPRKLRLEVEGGRFRVIAVGDDAQDIFHSNDDRLKTVSLPAK